MGAGAPEEKVQRGTGLFLAPVSTRMPFSAEVCHLPWPGEWVRDSGSLRCEWSRGEDACFKGGEGLPLEPGGDPSQSHQPFMSRAPHNSIPPQPAPRAGMASKRPAASDRNEKSPPRRNKRHRAHPPGYLQKEGHDQPELEGGRPPGDVVSPTGAGIEPSLKLNRPIQSCVCQALSQAPGPPNKVDGPLSSWRRTDIHRQPQKMS